MAEKQHYFHETILQRIEVPFIRLLDSELSPQESITLRRIIMARSPIGAPTKRLVHNIDFNWSGNKVIITTPNKYLLETTNLANNLIPALRHDYGPGIDKWFTASGIQLFKDHVWDPETAKCSTKTEQATRAIAIEDLWDLGDDWRKFNQDIMRPTVPTSPPMTSPSENKDRARTTLPDQPVQASSTHEAFGDDSDIQSFASAFQ